MGRTWIRLIIRVVLVIAMLVLVVYSYMLARDILDAREYETGSAMQIEWQTWWTEDGYAYNDAIILREIESMDIQVWVDSDEKFDVYLMDGEFNFRDYKENGTILLRSDVIDNGKVNWSVMREEFGDEELYIVLDNTDFGEVQAVSDPQVSVLFVGQKNHVNVLTLPETRTLLIVLLIVAGLIIVLIASRRKRPPRWVGTDVLES